MISEIWLTPPLAFARIGSSEHPLAAYAWGPNDRRPRGTGKTTLLPMPTLTFNEDGTLSVSTPKEVVFKDGKKFRPVCPFFELHAAWDDTGGQRREGPLTTEMLDAAGISVDALRWRVHVANLKPFHMSRSVADRVEAIVSVAGGDTSSYQLLGSSPGSPSSALASTERPIPLGTVRLSRPSTEVPGFRLRFTPPVGHVYAPSDLAERLASIPDNVRSAYAYEIPVERRTLNPNTAWSQFNARAGDVRTNPSLLYAKDDQDRSLGLVDDVSDGLVSCEIQLDNGTRLTARARIVVAPPDYAPDRRPFVSLADGLKDRAERHADTDEAVTDEEINDLMERIWETMALSNLDIQNERCGTTNGGIRFLSALPRSDQDQRPFKPLPVTEAEPRPLTAHGRRHHARFASLEVFRNLVRSQPNLLTTWIREPMTEDPYYNNKMPAMMRGSDRHPLHLTRRQYNRLSVWIAEQQAKVNSEGREG